MRIYIPIQCIHVRMYFTVQYVNTYVCTVLLRIKTKLKGFNKYIVEKVVRDFNCYS